MFKGDVEAEGSSGKVEVEKKHSATFDLTGANPYTLANNLEPDPYDDWDKQQEKYHEQYSASAGNSYSPYSYGSSDLNYYGSFYNIPGYGMMWQPYLVGAGWDPFMNGAWMWYPGSGYTWVSSYPWGGCRTAMDPGLTCRATVGSGNPEEHGQDGTALPRSRTLRVNSLSPGPQLRLDRRWL